MSCYNNCYLPEPPRAWSRVQNNCSLIIDANNSGLVKLPYSNKIIPVSSLGQELAMLNKGNVLQYKANSSNLTKAQRYSKIAQGQWVNRNTTWATQSTSGFTNPNTTSLKRSGNVVNIAIDPITGAIIGPTTAPPTCPQTIIPNNGGLPSNGGGGSDVDDPNIPPPVEPTPGSNTFPVIIPDTPVEPIVIQDGGILICSVQENVCTGETKSSLSQQLCNPTTDSDVPGTIQDLCWNDGTPTWYPRSRYIMTNSTNKWPVNATLVSAVRPYPPVITSVTNNDSTATVTWTQDETCLPVLRFIIFINDVPVKTVDGTVFTTDITIDKCIANNIYIIGENGNIVSRKSNTVSVVYTTHYTVTGNFSITYNNTHTFISFTNPLQIGTIVFVNNYSTDIIAVGGGGGGGGGSNNNQSSPCQGGGGGGGGGGIGFTPGYTLTGNTIYTISIGSGGGVGSGGNNQGSPGGNTIFKDNSIPIITAYGGGEGYGNYGNNAGGIGGIAIGSTNVYSSANGGNGSRSCNGNTGPTGQNGSNISPNMPITSGTENFYFSGGGGGGVYNKGPNNYKGGGAGINGIGGLVSGSGSPNSNGNPATTRGAGGGGGGCPFSSNGTSFGGGGASGTLLIIFPTQGC